MYVPVLGRLTIMEWPLLAASLFFTWLEHTSKIITQWLPTPIIELISWVLSLAYRFTSSPTKLVRRKSHSDGDEYDFEYIAEEGVSSSTYKLATDIMNARNLRDMVHLFGYEIENKLLFTKDNYLLNIHHLVKPGHNVPRNGKVVYLHHGLLMCSEIWATMAKKEQNLPFVLHDLGYDVWLGNNRGNKYSHKHVTRLLDSAEFWDFSLDEFALFDIPDTIDYILLDTGKKSLIYIGFSQGTAQAFASVSIRPDLHSKVERIIAISPATTPQGLYSRFLDVLLKSSPNLIFLLFSRKVLMPSVMFWERIMYPPFFDTSIDLSNYMLFNWRALNIDKVQKLASYAHLYSTTSVKTVVHWFQIMKLKDFQMYVDSNSVSLTHTTIVYPLTSIKIPIDLIYGDSDSLVDIDVMLGQLPPETTSSHVVPNHEHLDNLWGRDVHEVVFPKVLLILGEKNVRANGSAIKSLK